MNLRLLLNGLVFGSVIIAMVLDYRDNSLYYIFKPLTTILVILIPVALKTDDKTFKKWIFIALLFCLLGDILLLKNEYFVFGLGAFLIGHLLFAKGFMLVRGFQKNMAIALFLLVIGVGLYAWLYPDLGRLKYPVAAYILVILFMAWQGIGLYLASKTKAHALIAIGVILFMFSDTMIAVNKFKVPVEYAGLVILSTYWCAIALIANAGLMIAKRI